MCRHGSSVKDMAKVVLYAPNLRSYRTVVGKLGFNSGQIQDPLFDSVGNTGTSHALMLLVVVLEEAKPGDKILLGSYGDGSDVMMGKGAKCPIFLPTELLEIICPYAPGGSIDSTARQIATVGPKYFGQPMVVVNKPRSAGSHGVADVISSKSDGGIKLFLQVHPTLRQRSGPKN